MRTSLSAAPAEGAAARLLRDGAATLRPKVVVDVARPLGAGAFGDVCAASWAEPPEDGAEIVVKVVRRAGLSQKARLQLDREIVLHAELPPHPGVIPMLGAYEAARGDTLHLVLRAAVGDCATALAAGAPLARLAPRLAADLLGAVAHLHAHEIVHSDLKPANLLLDRRCRLQLCDLGAAARIADGGGRSTLVGSPAYLAPEVVAITHLGLQTCNAGYSFAA